MGLLIKFNRAFFLLEEQRLGDIEILTHCDDYASKCLRNMYAVDISMNALSLTASR